MRPPKLPSPLIRIGESARLVQMSSSVTTEEAAIPRRSRLRSRVTKIRRRLFRRGRPSEEENNDIPHATANWADFARKPGARGRAVMWAMIRIAPRILRAKLSRSEESRILQKKKGGEAVTNALIGLGPTYVKIGQIASCRDEIPPEYSAALERLQDNVPAFDGDYALAMAEAALGRPLDTVFKDFDSTPLAAASLGQVHRATLTEEFGAKEVAVKVQRDGLREMYDLDLALMEKIFRALDKINLKVAGASQDWTKIFFDCRETLYREIDYEAEAANAARFHADFNETSWVETPTVMKNLCTEKMLVMEYLPGIKINDIKTLDATPGINRKVLADNLAKSYLLQFCKYGFFNTDPHPGNIAVCPTSGQLIFYDFGQACELAPNQQQGILDVIESIIDMDVKKCVGSLDMMGVIKPGSDLACFENVVAKNFASGKVKSPKGKKTLAAMDPEAQKAALAEAEVAGKAVMPFVLLPAEYAFAARALQQMDGVGKMLDPEFEFITAAAPGIVEVKGTSDYMKDMVEKTRANAFKKIEELIPWKIEELTPWKV